MEIKSIDRQKLRVIEHMLEGAFAQVAKDTGLAIRFTGGTFTPTHATLKLELATKGQNGEVNTKEADDFKFSAVLYGLKETDIGRVFSSGGRHFKIVGLKPKSHRRPIVAELIGPGARKYSFPAEAVRIALENEAHKDSQKKVA